MPRRVLQDHCGGPGCASEGFTCEGVGHAVPPGAPVRMPVTVLQATMEMDCLLPETLVLAGLGITRFRVSADGGILYHGSC